MSHTFQRLAAPALPEPPREYMYAPYARHNNVLRLFFNQLVASVGALQTESLVMENDINFNRRYTLVMT